LSAKITNPIIIKITEKIAKTIKTVVGNI
jgi:hypothetical protein